MYRRPGHLIRRCQQIAVALFLEECKRFKLRPIQYAVLTAVRSRGQVDQITLSGLVALDRSTIGNVVHRLEKRGLLKRLGDARDRRVKVISLTGPGKHLLKKAEPVIERVQEKFLQPLPKAERRQFVAMLGRIAEKYNHVSRAPLRQQD